MDTAKLWFALLCVCGSWTISCDCLAINCDWTTEYENGRCCKSCPSGEYPKVKCTEASRESKCEKCPPDTTHLSKEERCFCKDKHLCSADNCAVCEPRQQCKPGEQLIRHGEFDYNFVCEPNKTYYDAEDNTCKNKTKYIGTREIFPGNQTNNKIHVSPDPSPGPVKEPQNMDTLTHSCMVAWFTVIVLTCLVFIIYTSFKFFKCKMLIKQNYSKPCTHSIVMSSDCKLSEQEKGFNVQESMMEKTVSENSDDHSLCLNVP